jgi:spore maturation protein CgeB
MRIAFFGSSLVSAYRNGVATYYRGILRALARRGHAITFYEPDAHDRQRHRDIPDPPWAKVVVYPGDRPGAARALASAARCDLLVKASGVGVNDQWLEAAVPELRCSRVLAAYWDVDAPATLERVRANPADPFGADIPRYDVVFTHGGGPAVVAGYRALGARRCVPIYNGVDPDVYFPVDPDPRFAGDLGFLGNRLPDREARVDEFFFGAAARLPDCRFVLGGSGWDGRPMPPNVRYVGHVYTADHNAFNVSARAVLNVNRDSMARVGHSPATRVFEAAGAGACVITDAFAGVERFLEPEREILVAADGGEVAAHLAALPPLQASAVGRRARERVLASHTYEQRAGEVEATLGELVSRGVRRAAEARP